MSDARVDAEVGAIDLDTEQQGDVTETTTSAASTTTTTEAAPTGDGPAEEDKAGDGSGGE